MRLADSRNGARQGAKRPILAEGRDGGKARARDPQKPHCQCRYWLADSMQAAALRPTGMPPTLAADRR